MEKKLIIYVELDSSSTLSDKKLFSLILKVYRGKNSGWKDNLNLKYGRKSPYPIRDDEDEHIQIWDLIWKNKRENLMNNDDFTVGIIRISGFNTLLSIGGNSAATENILKSTVDQITLNLLEYGGKQVRRILISDQGINDVIKNKNRKESILYSRYFL